MANNEIKTAIVVEMDDKDVTKGARNITRATDSMTQRLTRSTQRVNAQFKNMSQGLNNASSGLIGFGAKIAAAYGGAQAIKMVWEYNDGLKDTARRLNWSTTQIDQHKQALFDLQLEYGTSSYSFGQFVDEVARGAQTSEEFIAKARLGAIAMRGLTMEGKESAAVLAMLDEAGVRDPEYMLNRFANIGQASNGRFKSSEIATGTYEVMKNSSLAKNEETVLQVSSMLQALSGSNETIGDAVSKLNAIINDMSGSDFREFAKQRTGHDVFKVEDNKLVLKDLQSLIDIMAKDTEKGEYKNKLWYDQWRTLQGRLSADAASGIQGLAGKGEAVQQIKKSQGVSANQTALDRSRNFDASMSKLMATMQRFADMNLADPIERFAIAMSQLDPSDIQNILNDAKDGAKILAGILAMFAGAKAIDSIKSINIKGGGTIAMSIAVGKLAIDYLSDKANKNQDKVDYKNQSSEQFLMEKLFMPLQTQMKEMGYENGLGDSTLVSDLMEQVYRWNKNGLYQDNDELFIKSLSWLKENAGVKSHGQLRDANDDLFTIFPSNRIEYNKPEKNLDIVKRGDFNFKEGADVNAIYKELVKANDISKSLENIKLQPQKFDVHTKVDVDIKSDPSLKVTSMRKESTVNTPEKRGYTGGGDY